MCGPGAGAGGGRRKQGSTAPNGAVDDNSKGESDPDDDGGEDFGEDEEEDEEEEGLGRDAFEVEEEDTDEGERGDAGAAAEPGGAQRTAAGAALSTHERRLARMAARIARMEEENMGEREWFLRGEAGAGAPLRSFEGLVSVRGSMWAAFFGGPLYVWLG